MYEQLPVATVQMMNETHAEIKSQNKSEIITPHLICVGGIDHGSSQYSALEFCAQTQSPASFMFSYKGADSNLLADLRRENHLYELWSWFVNAAMSGRLERVATDALREEVPAAAADLHPPLAPRSSARRTCARFCATPTATSFGAGNVPGSHAPRPGVPTRH
jgi:hypothetical protein